MSSNEKTIDHSYTDEIVCPYCGHEHSESYEWDDDSGDATCDACGKEFSYFRNRVITYTTYKND